MKNIAIWFILLLPQWGTAQLTILYDTLFFRHDSLMVVSIMKSEGILKDGYKTGVWQEWYSNGQLSDSAEYAVFHKNEIRIYNAGQSFFGFTDTCLIRRNLKEKYSLPVGRWISYYQNGQVQMTGSYLTGGMVKTSITAVLGENGDVNEVYVISEPEGIKTGMWKYYNENGRIELQENYLDGILIGDN